MRNTSTSVILLIVFASLCSTASADLILSINANDKTFAITGTDTGSAAATGSGAGLTQWEITGLGSVDGGMEILTITIWLLPLRLEPRETVRWDTICSWQQILMRYVSILEPVILASKPLPVSEISKVMQV